MSECRSLMAVGGVLIVVLFSGSAGADAEHPLLYGLGRAASANDISRLDIAIDAAGTELPPGSGDVATGATLFAQQCAMCHGAQGHEGPDHRLVGGQGSLDSAQPIKTIGSYWPYATTLFDYIRRAMPFFAPGSLDDNAVYALTAWLLYQNGIIKQDAVMNRTTLPAVHMPNRDRFVPDPRPDPSTGD